MGHMTFQRLRVLRFPVLGSLLLAVGSFASAQTPAGQETSAASVAKYACRSRCRSIPKSSSARCRTACATTCARTAKPAHRAELRLVVKAGSVLEDDDQQGLAHFVEHMEFEGTRHFPAAEHRRLPVVARLEHRPGRERGDELRRHAVHAARADRRARRARSRAARARGLGAAAPRSIRAASIASAASCCRNGGCTSAPASARRTRSAACSSKGSRYADRPPIGKPDIIEHAQREQLMRFYRDWYRPDLMAVIVVGDVDRDAVAAMIKEHFSSLTVAVAGAAAAGVRRAGASRHALRHRHRQGDDGDGRRSSAICGRRATRDRSAATASIMLRPVVRRHARRPARRARPEREPAVSAGPPPIAACSRRRRTRDEAVLQALVVERRRRARPRRARHRAPARRAVRLHRDRARPREAGDDARLRARRRRKAPTASRRAAPTSTRATFSQSEALPTIWQELAFHRRFVPEHHADRSQRARRATGFPSGNRLVVVSAPEAAGVVLPDQSAARGGRQGGVGEAARGRMSTPRPGRR